MQTIPRSIVLFKSKRDNTDPYEQELHKYGYHSVIFLPLLKFETLNFDLAKDALENPHRYSGVVITSQRAMESLLFVIERYSLAEVWKQWNPMKAYTIGYETRNLCEHAGLTNIVAVASSAAELAKHIQAPDDSTRPFLYLCGETRRDELPTALRERSVPFEELIIYKSQDSLDPALLAMLVDVSTVAWLVFFSPSGVRIVYDALKASQQSYQAWFKLPKAAIGPTTAQEVERLFEHCQAVASRPEPGALSEALRSFPTQQH